METVHFPTWRGRPIPLTRTAIENEIERLIDLLDVADPDVDLEDDGNGEPSLGWPGNGPAALASVFKHDDRELEDENDEDGGDTEPNGDELDYMVGSEDGI